MYAAVRTFRTVTRYLRVESPNETRQSENRLIQPRKFIMNKDQVKGTAKNLAGQLQEEAGKLVGSTHQQVKGLNKQSEGKAQKSLGDVKEVVKDASDSTKAAIKGR
jgi:uncharacterized protein YjbJ (UPF0337 family)